MNTGPKVLSARGTVNREPFANRRRDSIRTPNTVWHNLTEQRVIIIALLALTGIAIHLFLRFGLRLPAILAQLPLFIVLGIGGVALIYDLIRKMVKRQFGSDLLAGISIVTSVLLGEYLAGSIVVLMLSGGETLEAYAVRSASSVLNALARRIPSVAHRKHNGTLTDLPLDQISPGDTLVVFPHEICPVDGTVTDGHGVMDESYLTGEPFRISKAPGVAVISGAVNGHSALTITATKRAIDSRYAKIMETVRAAEENRPHLRRLGDRLGAIYTPVAVAIAIVAWIMTADPIRFLAVLVVATPCPLLIAIPVAIIGAISLCARRAIIVRNAAVLEQVNQCRTAIFDKTGTLTYGEPSLVEILPAPGFVSEDVLRLAASLEIYSKHPLARAILQAADQNRVCPEEPSEVHEPPGEGLSGLVGGRRVIIIRRSRLSGTPVDLPPQAEGLECVLIIDGAYAATFRFRDAPRAEGASFISTS